MNTAANEHKEQIVGGSALDRLIIAFIQTPKSQQCIFLKWLQEREEVLETRRKASDSCTNRPPPDIRVERDRAAKESLHDRGFGWSTTTDFHDNLRDAIRYYSMRFGKGF